MTDSVIERAKKNLEKQVDRMRYTHEVGRKCLRYVAGDPWEAEELLSRGKDRPALVINKLSPFVNIVVNKNAMERARIKVSPFEDSDVDKAKVINGLIRHIQYSEASDASAAYSHAFFCLVTSGFGYWRVNSQYVDEMSVDEQELSVEKIEDPFSVYVDPKRKYAFAITFMDKDEYEVEYGEYEGSEWDIPELQTRCGDDEVMLVEYWEETSEETEIYKIDVPEPVAPVMPEGIGIDEALAEQPQQRTGVMTVTKKELDAISEYTVISSRTTKIPKITRYLFAGEKTVEEDEWDGKYTPIVGVYGREFVLESGEHFYKPLVFDALDPQKLHNVVKSLDLELMLQAPKAVWQGVAGQFVGHEDEYDNANLDITSRLEYEQVTVDGHLAPPPQRILPPQPSVAYYNAVRESGDDIKATIGMFNQSLGNEVQAKSGRAIIEQRQQGDLATYHFTSAFNVGMRLTGLIFVDLIPYKYDTARTLRIIGEDMADELVKINQGFVDKDGKPKLYDLTSGRYDVTIEVGPSSATRRADAADGLLEFARVVPQAGAISGDFIAKNMDFEYADELALRLKAAIPQQLLDRVKQLQQGEQGGGPQGPSREQQALMAMQQQLGKAMQALQGAAKENQSLKTKISGDKIIIEQIRAKAGITEEQIRAATDLAIARMNQQPAPFIPDMTGVR